MKIIFLLTWPIFTTQLFASNNENYIVEMQNKIQTAINNTQIKGEEQKNTIKFESSLTNVFTLINENNKKLEDAFQELTESSKMLTDQNLKNNVLEIIKNSITKEEESHKKEIENALNIENFFSSILKSLYKILSSIEPKQKPIEISNEINNIIVPNFEQIEIEKEEENLKSGCCYYEKAESAKTNEEKIELLNQAINILKEVKSQKGILFLGKSYYRLSGIETDDTKKIELLNKAIKKLKEAQEEGFLFLVYCHYDKAELAKTNEEKTELFNQAIDILNKMKSQRGIFFLGICHCKLSEIETNDKKKIELLNKAIGMLKEVKNEQGRLFLGICHYKLSVIGTNEKEKIILLNQAINILKEIKNEQGFLYLGICYYNKAELTETNEKRRNLFIQAGDTIEKIKSKKGCLNSGNCYFRAAKEEEENKLYKVMLCERANITYKRGEELAENHEEKEEMRKLVEESCDEIKNCFHTDQNKYILFLNKYNKIIKILFFLTWTIAITQVFISMCDIMNYFKNQHVHNF